MWRAAARQLVDRALGARAAHVIHLILSFSFPCFRFSPRTPRAAVDPSRYPSPASEKGAGFRLRFCRFLPEIWHRILFASDVEFWTLIKQFDV